MRPIIPKSPEVPKEFSAKEISFLTKSVFGEIIGPQPCDVLFVFSGTHPGHWEKAIEAYQKSYVRRIIVSGGRSLTGTPHPDWNGHTEAEVIIQHLMAAGIPEEAIKSENSSSNTLENVLFAKEIFDFNTVETVMFICKSHATGRQWRTLAQHLPKHLRYIPYTFNAFYKDVEIGRDSWMNTDIGKSRVWGEYLRLLHYGEKGDILKLDVEL
ncbi:YdcF family protein [Streptococcus sp. IsoGale021]|uniref:YdcF family protein n=1 Tax=Streptococcus TaxID=1301 RepID=UPI0020012227|nr:MULTISPECIES: YdcF family protein [Streptococcus]MCY7210539.1 YdcF family protein [Streptococcus anginosus]MCY7211767.1 YdcF family protein [Streptococcus anginosus]MCY7226728.1 YdcF family protein [Streptococcus anginosus]MDQ8695113.1 YdcF family protein [Streptococcus sp. IsoGale021]MDU5128551.1 YdcF family protein [Streptococcus anginosus]